MGEKEKVEVGVLPCGFSGVGVSVKEDVYIRDVSLVEVQKCFDTVEWDDAFRRLEGV
jgi:hypothetical protein